MIRFFNTLSRQKEEFKPLQDKLVRWYACGPTVYADPHIGNYRAYVFVDLLRRFLEYRGYKVMLVMNLTDVDDKTIKGSKEKGVSLKEFTRHYEKVFFEDLKTLEILPADYYPRATEHIQDMLAIIQELLAHKKAYKSDDGSVYYDISSFKDYGKLSDLMLENLQAGASGRVKKDEYTKENVSDFVLWKAYDEADGDVFWDTKVGKGRPGWHIECSAMSTRYLGYAFDIHTGGVDLIFPHHENEIAQSEGVSSKPFVRYWLHNEHLLVDGRKMSKSLGNFYTLRDVLAKGFNPLAVRYVLLATHYRSQVNFTFDAVHAAENTLTRLQDFLTRLKESNGEENKRLEEQLEKTKKRVITALEDDLDVSTALAAVFELEKETNKALEQKMLSKALAEKIALFFWNDFNTVFGVLKKKSLEVTEDVKALVEEREKARKAKDFKKADTLRQKIKEKGFWVEDTDEGPRIRKVLR